MSVGLPIERKTVYIAGPMTGVKDYNYPAFFKAEDKWAKKGWKVFNPARNSKPITIEEMPSDEARAYFMKKDIEMVMEADAIAVLPGWETSVGAKVEVAVAKVLLHKTYDALTMKQIKLPGQ